MEEKRLGTTSLVLSAALAAAVFVATVVVRIPIPATGGYLNFGDAVIILAALLFGPLVGAIAGGVGACAADLVGFPVFAVPTLVIKGLMGAIVGTAGGRSSGIPRAVGSAALGEAWMVLGYFGVETWVFSRSMGLDAAIAEVYFNFMQAAFGLILGCSAYAFLRKQRSIHLPS